MKPLPLFESTVLCCRLLIDFPKTATYLFSIIRNAVYWITIFVVLHVKAHLTGPLTYFLRSRDYLIFLVIIFLSCLLPNFVKPRVRCCLLNCAHFYFFYLQFPLLHCYELKVNKKPDTFCFVKHKTESMFLCGWSKWQFYDMWPGCKKRVVKWLWGGRSKWLRVVHKKLLQWCANSHRVLFITTNVCQLLALLEVISVETQLLNTIVDS